MLGRSRPRVDLPDGVLLSVREVSRAAPRPDPGLPPWLRRVLPKSGFAGQLPGSKYDLDDEEDPDDEDQFYAERGAAVAPDRKSTRLNSSHIQKSRMPSSA